MARPDRIYFARAATGLVKIGTSCRVRTRLSSLRKVAGAPLELLAEIPGEYSLERGFHHVLAAHRTQGREWFNPASDVLGAAAYLRGESPAGLSPAVEQFCREVMHGDGRGRRRVGWVVRDSSDRRSTGAAALGSMVEFGEISLDDIAEATLYGRQGVENLLAGGHAPPLHVAAAIEIAFGIPMREWLDGRRRAMCQFGAYQHAAERVRARLAANTTHAEAV